ncbi:MAG: hypothetical protein ACI8Y4_004263 [Candidatus Poriferisodalaceae bacterium]|jgi:hypothetical protein
METEPEDPQAGVIDLAPISDACGDLVVSGADTNSRNDIVGAIERLRHVANYNNAPPGQTPLPDFESTDGTA